MLSILCLVFLFYFGSPDEQSQHRYTVIYDIRDLEVTVPNYLNAPEFDLNAALSGRGQSPFRDSQQVKTILPAHNGEEIINLITTFVEPDAWGSEATIRYYRGNLIIDAPQRIHKQIR